MVQFLAKRKCSTTGNQNKLNLVSHRSIGMFFCCWMNEPVCWSCTAISQIYYAKVLSEKVFGCLTRWANRQSYRKYVHFALMQVHIIIYPIMSDKVTQRKWWKDSLPNCLVNWNIICRLEIVIESAALKITKKKKRYNIQIYYKSYRSNCNKYIAACFYLSFTIWKEKVSIETRFQYLYFFVIE